MDKQREPVGSWKDPGSSNCRQCLLPRGQETRRGLGIVKTQRLGGSSPLSCTQTSEKTPGVWVPGLALESALWPPRADEATLVNLENLQLVTAITLGKDSHCCPREKQPARRYKWEANRKKQVPSPFSSLSLPLHPPLAESSWESADKTKMRFEAPQFQHLKENTREGLEVR